MATLPTRTLEIEFDTGVWTDVAADVVSIGTRRGRNRESGAFETGTMVFTVRNDTRKYDPDNTAGTYYGKLRPNRRARFKATYSAQTWPIFQGFIDRITQDYGGPNDATATFECSDMFKILNRVELPRSVYVAAVAADAPDLWWPMDEPSGSATVVDIGTGKVAGVTFGNPGLGASGLVVRDPGSAMAVAGSATTGQGFMVEKNTWPSAAITGTGAFTIEAWIRAGNQTGDGYIFHQGGGADTPIIVKIRDAGGASPGLLDFRIGIASFVVSNIRVDDNSVHHIAARRAAGGDMQVFVDGVDVTTSITNAPTSLVANNFAWGSDVFQTGGLTGTIQHGAIYRTVGVATADLAKHNTAGRTPWNGELSGARMVHIEDLAGIPAGDRVTNAGSTTLQATDLGGTALAYAQKIEETEAGRVFISADGKFTFLDREHGETGTYLTSQATLVDDDSGAGRPYRFVSADVDEATIVTRATVSREGSVAVTYTDTTAVAEFQIIDETHDGLLHNSDAYSLYYAQWIVNTHKTLSSRVGTIQLDLPVDPANMYPDILGLELAERVTYKRKPQNTGAVISLPMRVESIAHETGGAYWRTTLQLSPFNLGQGGYGVGIWDTSLWDQAVWGL